MQRRKPVEMRTDEIERELENFEWEFIALSDRAASDEDYKDGEIYLQAREKELTAELAERRTKLAADGLTPRCKVCGSSDPRHLQTVALSPSAHR